MRTRLSSIWFDISWPGYDYETKTFSDKTVEASALKMLAMMRKLNPDLIMDDRGTGPYADYDTPEQYIPNEPPGEFWETSMTISNGRGFWYKGPGADYKDAEEIVHKLADIASKGGNFLLNVGPRPDGTLTDQEIETLLGTGKWMKKNGEAIYGTKGSPWGATPEWGRITRKGDRVYLIVFDWPADGKLALDLPRENVRRASLLAGRKIGVKAAGDGVVFELLATRPDKSASVIAVDLKGELHVTPKWPAAKKKNCEPRARETASMSVARTASTCSPKLCASRSRLSATPRALRVI
jgi:alpha-L-fucosidase